MKPEDFLSNKQLYPTDLDTVGLGRLPLEIRERAFFMATVADAEILDVFQDVVGRVQSGELSLAEGRWALREGLAELNYLPAPGEEGTIKDLRTMQRMNVVIETNAAMARNYAAEKVQAASPAFPVKELVRMGRSQVPRDWVARWARAYGQLTDAEKRGASIDPPMAKVGHRIWYLISRFNAPYAPFDFGSKMGTIARGRAAAKAAGIDLQASVAPLPATLNDGLEATPRVKDDALKARMAEKLKGLATWDGQKLTWKKGGAA